MVAHSTSQQSRVLEMLEAHQLSINLGSHQILNNISVQALAGHFYTILGPNGAGKSTLLKALSGDVATAKTLVKLDGTALADYSASSLASHRSVLPQAIHLDFPFLVSEIIEIALTHLSSQKRQQEWIRKALAMFDVEHLVNRNYLTLSGGEQQRVQLARVTAQLLSRPDSGPKYLLLDECVANLDLAHQHQVFSQLKAMTRNQRICVITVLHDLHLASQYSDELWFMKAGELVKRGKPETVLTKETVKAVYDFEATVQFHPSGWPMVIPR